MVLFFQEKTLLSGESRGFVFEYLVLSEWLMVNYRVAGTFPCRPS